MDVVEIGDVALVISPTLRWIAGTRGLGDFVAGRRRRWLRPSVSITARSTAWLPTTKQRSVISGISATEPERNTLDRVATRARHAKVAIHLTRASALTLSVGR